MNTLMRPRAFLSLPVEIRHMIKRAIPSFDLRTHVCFYSTHLECAALYGSEAEEEEFWTLICWNNGLGKLRKEELRRNRATSWREIAFACIRDDGFCTHPQCGESLLEYNRQRMKVAAAHVKPTVPYRIHDTTSGVPCDIHRALGQVGFRRSDELRGGVPLVESDAFLRCEKNCSIPAEASNTSDMHKKHYLKRHPLIARSFATSTPVSSFFLLNVCDYGPRNADTLYLGRPVTVLDVLSMIQEGLPEDLRVRDVSDYIKLHRRCIAKKHWSLDEVLGNLATARNILSICPIQDMEHTENTSLGPAFSLMQY